jgi:hypothetical protein
MAIAAISPGLTKTQGHLICVLRSGVGYWTKQAGAKFNAMVDGSKARFRNGFPSRANHEIRGPGATLRGSPPLDGKPLNYHLKMRRLGGVLRVAWGR